MFSFIRIYRVPIWLALLKVQFYSNRTSRSNAGNDKIIGIVIFVSRYFNFNWGNKTSIIIIAFQKRARMEGQDSSLIAEENGAENRENKIIYLLIGLKL